MPKDDEDVSRWERIDGGSLIFSGASQMAQQVKNPPAMKELWVRSLGREGPMEEEMATHSSILA